jgi:hypothetical protein
MSKSSFKNSNRISNQTGGFQRDFLFGIIVKATGSRTHLDWGKTDNLLILNVTIQVPLFLGRILILLD